MAQAKVEMLKRGIMQDDNGAEAEDVESGNRRRGWSVDLRADMWFPTRSIQWVTTGSPRCGGYTYWMEISQLGKMVWRALRSEAMGGWGQATERHEMIK